MTTHQIRYEEKMIVTRDLLPIVTQTAALHTILTHDVDAY